MSRSFLAAGIAAILAIAGSAAARADTVTVTDVYWGGDPTSGSDTDRIGNSQFEITKAVITRSTTSLQFDIYTSYADAFATDNNLLGTKLGDLFLSTNGWTPSGVAPWVNDFGAVGEGWEYAVDLSNVAPKTTSGSAALWAVSNGTIKYSQDVTSGSFRSGQEVLFNPTAGKYAVSNTTGSWALLNVEGDSKYDIVRITISSTGPTLLTGAGSVLGNGVLGFHWDMTCANDVIEGQMLSPTQQIVTPEPATMILMAAGLAGLGARARRRREQQAS